MTEHILWTVLLLFLAVMNGIFAIDGTSTGAKIFSLVVSCLCCFAIGLHVTEFIK